MIRPRFLILGAAVAVLLAGAWAYVLHRDPVPVAADVAGPQLGGPFHLVDQNGRAVTERDLRGKPTIMFFGFTYCPEVCPTTLLHMSAWLRALGPDGNRLNVVYVTVDPERDTPAQLHAYLSAFDPRIRGLTGSPQDIASVAREYRVFYEKVPTPGGGYTMDHSTLIYMLDANGRFVGPIGYDEPDTKVLPVLRELVRG